MSHCLYVYSTKHYDRDAFTLANQRVGHSLEFLEVPLDARTATLAQPGGAVCAFVNDDLGEATLTALAAREVKLVALRCAGFNQVDLTAARRLGIRVMRVPAYSPNAVAEHTLALILALNRRIPRAYNRVRDGNFSLEGLVGFDLAGKTAGVVGTGKIGTIVARLLWHLRCHVVACDPVPNEKLIDLGVRYTSLDEVVGASDIVSLNCPLTPETHHIINAARIETMKHGVMLVNTGRGGLVDTAAVIEGLKSERIGFVALDVYEEEAELFFQDRSNRGILDDVFARLLSFPNVLVTAHQGFLTHEALTAISATTLQNLTDFAAGRTNGNEI